MDKCLLRFAVLVPLIMVGVEAIRGSYKPQCSNVKLFVFGDSYVDTGNTPKDYSRSWRQPYGITYPGKPAGRFSDGRILTDYIAQFFNVKSPAPYEQRKCRAKFRRHGMNFAYGGTGVFDTTFPLPNMTIQINYFQRLLENNLYTKKDLASSIALISVAGNDYATYLTRNRSIKGIPGFASSLIKQFAANLQRIHDWGVPKIGVVAIEPLGCLPRFTAPLFIRCNRSLDLVAKSHNLMLRRAVKKLRNENKGAVFVILNLYRAFITALDRAGNSLRPCCMGVGIGNNCGSVDDNGAARYTVCKDRNSSFFWDLVHPSQHGWDEVYSFLRHSLKQFC